MKTTTTGITRLFGYMLLAGGLLVASCGSEEEQKGGDPIEPGGESGDRREVMLTLKNKLALTPATQGSTGDPATKAPIATAAENDIRTLDVYVFGSDTEGGEYTFQERFAYRAGDNDKLPAGATELQLAVQGTDGTETSGLLKLKRGLFVKLYCIANDVALIDPAGDGITPVQPTGFVPLVLSTPGETGTKVATPGVPLESSFTSYHTRLLAADAKGDTLACPLAMSGALTTALDLTSFENSARLQAGFKLTRLSARFDIQNVASDSRFTLQSVSMGSGRRGSGYFPIRVYGDLPTAKPAELLTYPVRAFYGGNANNGLCTGAFYSYPSPQADKGFLILQGVYKVNETESTEVSYQIPFRQTNPNGQEVYLDINNNHRYTIAITAADAYHLDANITVADWADDGSIEYTPENKPGEILVTIPPGYADETEENKDTKTVNMSVKPGSTFEMAITTNSALKLSKVYAGGVAGQLQNWLSVSEPVITPGATLSTYRYTVSLTTPYLLGRYPRATLRLTNTINGSESVLFVEPVAAPVPIETPQPPKAPNGSSDNPNTFDPAANTASLYRITGSQAQVRINCPDGIKLESKPDWLDVQVSAAVGALTTSTLTLNNRDAVVADNKGIVTFSNKKKADLKIDVHVTLLDAPVVPSYAGIGADNKVDLGSGGTPDNVIVLIKSDNKATVKTTSLDGVSVAITYEAGSPEWLKYEGGSSILAAVSPASFAVPNLTALGSPAATASVYASKAPQKTNELIFSPIESKLAGAKKATVTMKNIIGGEDYVITITPAMQAATAVKGAEASVPLQDALDAVKKSLTLYQLPGEGAATSKMQITVSSLGGSVLAFDGEEGGMVITPPAQNTTNTANYLLTPALADDKNEATGTLHVKNYTDPDQMTDYAVKVLRSDLLGGDKISLPAVKDQSATLKVSSYEGFKIDETKINWNGGTQWFKVSTLDFGGGADKVVTVVANAAITKVRPATVTLNNKIVNGGDLQVTVSPGYAVPALTVGTIPANSYNTLTATAGSATSTVKLYRVAGSNIQLKATSVGGSKLQGDPVGVTVTRNTGGDDFNTENTYTVTWDGSTTTEGSFQLVNSQDASQVQTVTVELPVTALTATNVSINATANTAINSAATSPEGFTASVSSWGTGGSAWFDLTPTDYGKGSQNVVIRVKANLDGINIQTATVTLTNKIAGGAPITFTVTPTLGGPTVAYLGSSSPAQNKMSGNTVTLYRLTGSKLTVRVTSVGGSKVTSQNGVTVTGGNNASNVSDYVVTLANNTTTGGSFQFSNFSDNSKVSPVITVNAPLTSSSSPGNISLNTALNQTASTTFNTPEGFTGTVSSWGTGGGAWFTLNAADFAAGNQTVTVKSTAPSGVNMQTATVTLTNKIAGGDSKTFTVTPTFAGPTMTYANNNSPVQNGMSGTTASLYNVANSRLNVTVSSVGGVTVASSTGVNVSANTSDNTSHTYTLTWNGSSGPGNYSVVFANKRNTNLKTTLTVTILNNAITAVANTNVNAANSGNNTISVTSPAGCTASIQSGWNGGGQWFDITTNPGAGTQNLVITQRNNVNTVMKPVTVRLTSAMVGGTGVYKDITVTPTGFVAPTLTPASGTINDFYLNIAQSATFTAAAPGGSTDATSSNTGVATVSRSGNTFTVTAVNLGTANITVPNSSATGSTSTYKITVASPKNYVGKAVWKYYGFYIAQEDAGKGPWTANLTRDYCSNKSGATWYVPSDAEWRTMLGGTSGRGLASAAVHKEYDSKGVFAGVYWSSTVSGSDHAYALFFGTGTNGNVCVADDDEQSYPGNKIRCVAK